MADWTQEKLINFFEGCGTSCTGIDAYEQACICLQQLKSMQINAKLQSMISLSYRYFESRLLDDTLSKKDLELLKGFFHYLFCSPQAYIPTHIHKVSLLNANSEKLVAKNITTSQEQDRIKDLILEQYAREYVANVLCFEGTSVISCGGVRSYEFDLSGSQIVRTRYFVKKYLRKTIVNLICNQQLVSPESLLHLLDLKFSEASLEKLQKCIPKAKKFGIILNGKCLPSGRHAVGIYLAQKKQNVWVCICNAGNRDLKLASGIFVYRLENTTILQVIEVFGLSDEAFNKSSDCVVSHLKVLEQLTTAPNAKLICFFRLSDQISGNCVYYAYLMIIFSHIACYYAHNMLGGVRSLASVKEYQELCGLVGRDYDWIIDELQITSVKQYLAQQMQYINDGRIFSIDRSFLTALLIRAISLYGSAILTPNSIRTICLLLLTTSLKQPYNLQFAELLLSLQLRKVIALKPYLIATFAISLTLIMALAARLYKARTLTTIASGLFPVCAAALWQYKSLKGTFRERYSFSMVSDKDAREMIMAPRP